MRSVTIGLVLAGFCAPLFVMAQSAPQSSGEAWRPATFNARIAFRIDADQTTRHRQFQAMLKKLTDAGFKKAPGLEGEAFYGDTITGTIPAAGTSRLLDDSHVQTALLVPDGLDLSADAEKPVLVRMQLTSTFGFRRQREVADKTRELLKPLKFQEAVGYDHMDNRRLMGWLPVGQFGPILDQKQQIVLAVPGQGTGNEPGEPRTVKLNPIQIVEVIREPMGAEPLKEPAEPAAPDPVYLDKVSADLRQLIAGLQGDEAQKPIRVEVILRTLPSPGTDAWRNPLFDAGLAIDGRIGPLVSGEAPPANVGALAALPEVSTVRLPQPSRLRALPPFDPARPSADVDFVPLRRFGAVTGKLAALVRRHEPQRVAVIAADFRGFQGLVGKQLPAKTSLLDFTGERSAEIMPEPPLEPAAEIGAGTRLAVLLQAAAPADEMLLVRIDAAAPYQVEEVARCVAGGRWSAEAFARRGVEIRNEKSRLDERKLDLRVQRRISLDNFGDDKDSVAAREEYRKRQAEVDLAEKRFNEKVVRYLQFQKETRQLKGLSTVLLGLNWADGHPALPGELQTLRFLDPEVLQGAAWIQALPRLTGQTWSGLFRDKNDNGVLEFIGADPKPSSTAEVNFIRWQPHGAREQSQLDLPAKAVVQVTLQWREVHSAAWKTRTGEDIYRRPLTPFRIVVLHQRDPEGKTLPTDLFEVVQRSSGLADRVENDDRTALYQFTLRFQVGAQPGRYAIRLEGRQPESTNPAEAGNVPGAERWELHPRLNVEVLDPASRAAGGVVLQHATDIK